MTTTNPNPTDTTTGMAAIRAARKAEDRFREASAKTEAARETRNRAVRQALVEGWTHQAIADALGITRARVGQIAA